MYKNFRATQSYSGAQTRAVSFRGLMYVVNGERKTCSPLMPEHAAIEAVAAWNASAEGRYHYELHFDDFVWER